MPKLENTNLDSSNNSKNSKIIKTTNSEQQNDSDNRLEQIMIRAIAETNKPLPNARGSSNNVNFSNVVNPNFDDEIPDDLRVTINDDVTKIRENIYQFQAATSSQLTITIAQAQIINEADNKVIAAQKAWTAATNIADATQKAWANAEKRADAARKAGEPITVIKAITAAKAAKHKAEIAAQTAQEGHLTKKVEAIKQETLNEAKDDAKQARVIEQEPLSELEQKMVELSKEKAAESYERANEELEREKLYASALIKEQNEKAIILDQAQIIARKAEKKSYWHESKPIKQ